MQFLCSECSPAGQDPDHVVGLVAFDADGTVVEVGLRLLVALPDGSDLQLADGFLRRVAETPLWDGERRRLHQTYSVDRKLHCLQRREGIF